MAAGAAYAEAGKITGLGGVFSKSKDPKALAAWYRDVLSIHALRSHVRAISPPPGPPAGIAEEDGFHRTSANRPMLRCLHSTGLDFATNLLPGRYLLVTRFYFHLHNDMDVSDDDGKELPDLEAAHAHAITMARFEVAEAAGREGRIVLSHHIDVEDENGAVLTTVYFGDAVKIEHGREAADKRR